MIPLIPPDMRRSDHIIYHYLQEVHARLVGRGLQIQIASKLLEVSIFVNGDFTEHSITMNMIASIL